MPCPLTSNVAAATAAAEAAAAGPNAAYVFTTSTIVRVVLPRESTTSRANEYVWAAGSLKERDAVGCGVYTSVFAVLDPLLKAMSPPSKIETLYLSGEPLGIVSIQLVNVAVYVVSIVFPDLGVIVVIPPLGWSLKLTEALATQTLAPAPGTVAASLTSRTALKFVPPCRANAPALKNRGAEPSSIAPLLAGIAEPSPSRPR
jgi:hypothetical protein